MRILSLTSLIFFLNINCFASDSLSVSFNKASYIQGEAIKWTCDLKNFGRDENAVTVQLWIENLSTKQIWQYRYPLLNGYVEGSVQIGDEIPDGKYAFNFLLQKDFFNIKGTAKYYSARDTFITYSMLTKNKRNTMDKVFISPNKHFEIKKVLFEDTALFMFAPSKRNDRDELWLDIKTSLDSVFTPLQTISKIVVIGAADTFTRAKIADIRSDDYTFDYKSKESQYILPEFVVRAKKKSIDDFVKDNVSALFQGIDDMNFDGLDNDEIARSVDIYSFLQTKVPGINKKFDPESGAQEFTWRNAPVGIYLDEFKLDADALLTVNPSDVALIKVYRPGFAPANLSATNGAIAVYTKRGNYDNNFGAHKNVFKIRGYDPLTTHWTL